MVSETICLNILEAIRGQVRTHTFTVITGPGNDTVKETRIPDSLSETAVYRRMMKRYSLADIDAALRWLYLGGYYGKSGMGGRPPYTYELTDKGREAADRNGFADNERELFYQEDPHAVFVAHQFNNADVELVSVLRDRVLAPAGFQAWEGRAEGLEEFRHAIMAKMRKARFFLCLLTQRARLHTGEYASSVWLYQEIWRRNGARKETAPSGRGRNGCALRR
ncbi:MAG: hypothetical protein ACREMA_08150 [Longimicrobiales bacterium]